MNKPITLDQFLTQSQLRSPELSNALCHVIKDIACAGKQIAAAVSQGALAGILGSAGSENIQGETQKKLDIVANDILLAQNQNSPYVAAVASEEMDDIALCHPEKPANSRYFLLIDPLDGSTNIDVNGSIGTIFSVLPAPDKKSFTAEDVLQPGHNQVAAGYILYGPSTQLILTTGKGVNSFTLDITIGEFLLTEENILTPDSTSEYAINAANQRYWESPIQQYIKDCNLGKEGSRGRNFNMRWLGAMVGDCHRVLCRGGVFLYPKDSRNADRAGKLRLLYEANPISFVMEQAGGAGHNAHQRIMDIQPVDLHQRVAVIVGSKEEVDYIHQLHQTN